MHGHNYKAGDRVYILKDWYLGTRVKGTVIDHAGGAVVRVQFDTGHNWYCTCKQIKPLVRVVG